MNEDESPTDKCRCGHSRWQHMDLLANRKMSTKPDIPRMKTVQPGRCLKDGCDCRRYELKAPG